LQVHKALHLNEQHPTLLSHALDAAPFLSLSSKRKIFRSAFRAALKQLVALQPANLQTISDPLGAVPRKYYRDIVVRNLRQVLDAGAGLPLLFPRYELGFGYDTREDESAPRQKDDWTRDTWAETPTLRVGYLVPHVRVQLVSCFESMVDVCGGGLKTAFPHVACLDAGDEADGDKTIQRYGPSLLLSTSNLPSQLTMDGLATYVLLLIGSIEGRDLDVGWLVERLAARLDLNLQLVQILSPLSEYAEMTRPAQDSVVPMPATRWPQRRLIFKELPSAFSYFPDEATCEQRPPRPPYFVLVRPDSHVQAISSVDSNDESSVLDSLLRTDID
jgi:hypothetical protein